MPAISGAIPPAATGSFLSQQSPLSDTATVARNYAIDDVVIKGKARKKQLGRRIESGFFSTGPLAVEDEAGVPCNAGKKTWRLGKFCIYCTTQQTDTLVFRLRLYKLADKTVGKPIPIPDILIPLRDSSQFITADLNPYDIRVTGEFLLAVECSAFSTRAPRGGMLLHGRMGARTFYRSPKNPQWGADLLGIGLSVEATPAPAKSDSEAKTGGRYFPTRRR